MSLSSTTPSGTSPAVANQTTGSPSSSQALAALQQFYTTFSANNQNIISQDVTSLGQSASSTLKPIVQKNILAINNLLTALMGSDASRNVSIQAITTSNTSTNTSTKNNSTGSPISSYNTRVPYVEIKINGTKAVPLMPAEYAIGNTLTVDNFLVASGIEVLFQDLELHMPIGGTESTIQGTLKLYSRTPIELLSFITLGLNELTSDFIDTDSGLPVCDIVMGWNIADGTSSGQIIRSPKIQFLITNIQMSDPGKTMGSEFTLTLQDAGSTCLDNSSSILGVMPDYPQQQLRLLIESCLGLRLFTLDDLLQLGSSNPSINFSSSNPSYQNETFFVNLPSSYLRLNSNTIGNAARELCESIACRWYPTANSNLKNAIDQASSANENITTMRNSFQNNSNENQQQEFQNEAIKIANCCILVWVPYFPVGIKTSSGDMYLKAADVATPGAFLLLPKYMEDISLNQVDLPVIYGPGSSGIPYFYGGGQNVFQKLTQLNNSYGATGFANLVGEVQDLTLNFSAMMAVMRGTYDEEVYYRQSGLPMIPAYTAKVATKNKNSTRVVSQEQIQAATNTQLKRLGLPAAVSQEQALELLTQQAKKSFKGSYSRFKHLIAQKKIFAGDSATTLLNTTGTNRSYTNPVSVSNFSFGKIQERIGTFLQCPLSIGMSVMGDPFLLRQGIGVFEIINYYPTIDGKSFIFNPLVSGVYMPTTITHRISIGNYTTEIQALKVPNNVANTATQTYSSILSAKAGGAADKNTDYAKIIKQVMSVNLDTLTPPGNPNLASSAPASNTYSASSQVSVGTQTQVLTQTILGNTLTSQMTAAFAQLAAINSAVQAPQTTSVQKTVSPTNNISPINPIGALPGSSISNPIVPNSKSNTG